MTRNHKKLLQANEWLEAQRKCGGPDWSYFEDREMYRWTAEWLDFTKALKAERGGKCEICKVGSTLTVHHHDQVNYDDLTKDKFSVLCWDCHNRVESMSKNPDEAPEHYKPHLVVAFQVRKWRTPPSKKSRDGDGRMVLVPEKGAIVPMAKLKSKFNVANAEAICGVAPLPDNWDARGSYKTTYRGLHLIEIRDGESPIEVLEEVLNFERHVLLKKARAAKPLAPKKKRGKKK